MGKTKKQKKSQRVRQKMADRQPSKASEIKDLMRRLDKMYPVDIEKLRGNSDEDKTA